MRNTTLQIGLCLLAMVASMGCARAFDPQAASSLSPGNGGPEKQDSWPQFVLRAEQTWQLNLPGGERFDASALVRTAAGDFLTVNDRGPTLYQIRFLSKTNAADLIEVPTCFTSSQLRPFAREKNDRYDAEGLALDSEGRIYMCEEADRWVLRCDPNKGTVEHIVIDWTPVRKYFDSFDRNASFEGIAVIGQRLYLANERQAGRIIAVDLATRKVVDDFAPHPLGSRARDLHYSDLSSYDGVLYVLLRESRIVLAVEPSTHQVLAEYNYKEMERSPELIYRSIYITAGQMEGLAVEKDYLWLVTDNNGCGRVKYPRDIRPTLFKCKREPFR